jgi:hypothetical protein
MGSKKIAFLHIPKTAGTYISTLREFRFEHLGHNMFTPSSELSEFRQHQIQNILDNRDDYVVFCCIRNPFDMLVSFFYDNFMKYKGWAGICSEIKVDRFRDFIKSFCEEDWSSLTNKHRFQNNLFHQMFDENNDCQVDVVIRQEYLDEGLSEFLSTYGIDYKKRDAVNKTNKPFYKNLYDEDMISDVTKKIEKILDMFEYDFDGPKTSEPIIYAKKLHID